MINPIINTEENRLRTGWRILLFILLFISLSFSVFGIRPLLGDIGKRAFMDNYSVLIIALIALSATISVILARRWFDKKDITSLGLTWNRRAMKDLGFGFLLSALMMVLFFMILWGGNLVDFRGLTIQPGMIQWDGQLDFLELNSLLFLGSLLVLLLEYVMVGFWEELVFRGYVFQNMKEGLGLFIAIIVSCLMYGLVHSTNPNATWLSTAIIVLFGFMRLFGYLATGQLWLSMGMHMAWNFFQGPIFGFAASGHTSAALIAHESLSETTYLTGGAFGPEGSILIVPVLVLAIIVMTLYAKKNYNLPGFHFYGVFRKDNLSKEDSSLSLMPINV